MRPGEKIVIKGELQGERRLSNDLVEKTFYIDDFQFKTSRHDSSKTYALIQCRDLDGQHFWFTCGAQRVMNALDQLVDKLPVKVTLAMQEIDSGKKVKYLKDIEKA